MIRLDQSSFFTDLEEIDRWLESRGFRRRDRLRVYRANIGEMAMREAQSHPGEIFAQVQNEGRLNEILSSYVEGIEFVEAMNALRSKRADIPDALLKRVLDGPADASREDHRSNQGRNAMFELSMGAMMAKQDLQPTFGLGNPDVSFQFQGRTVCMECKRVLSQRRILDNISEAVHQLESCVRPGNGDVGLVAISVSRLAHQGNGYWQTPSLEIGRAFLANELRRMVSDIDPRLAQLNRSHAAGVIFFVSGPLCVDNIGFTVAGEGIVYPLNPAESAFLHDFATTARL